MTTLRTNLISAFDAPRETPASQSGTRESAITVRVIRELNDWDELRPQWDELFDASPTASAPLRFDWLRTWWDLYGEKYADHGRGLRIFTAWRGDRLIGSLPLYEGVKHDSRFGVRRLGFLSSGEAEFEETCADYLDLLHLPGEADACIAAIARVILDRRVTRWDEFVLDRISATSPLLAMREHLGSAGQPTIDDRGICYLSDIRGGLDAYFERLPAKARKEARRTLRGVSESNADFEIATARTTQEFFDEMVMLHQHRWRADGKPGCFIAPRFTEFHRRLLHLWIPQGKALLARLSWEGKPLAVFQGVIVGKKFDGYVYGVSRDEESPIRGPGNAMVLLLKSYLGDLGMETLDTLRSKPDSHKKRNSTGVASLVRLSVHRSGVRTRLDACVRDTGRAARKAWRVLKRERVVPPVVLKDSE